MASMVGLKFHCFTPSVKRRATLSIMLAPWSHIPPYFVVHCSTVPISSKSVCKDSRVHWGAKGFYSTWLADTHTSSPAIANKTAPSSGKQDSTKLEELNGERKLEPRWLRKVKSENTSLTGQIKNRS